MSAPNQRALQMLAQLHTELGAVLDSAVQIALQQSPSALGLVTALEKMGYRVDTELDYLVIASPMEKVFEQSLTDDDRRFLSDPGSYIAG